MPLLGVKKNRTFFLVSTLSLAVALVIAYVLPPQGFDNGKFVVALLGGLGVVLAGMVQLRMLRTQPEQPMKAIGIGAGLRAVVVIIAILAAFFLLPREQLIGSAIAVIVIYFAVLIAETVGMSAILSEAKINEVETKRND